MAVNAQNTLAAGQTGSVPMVGAPGMPTTGSQVSATIPTNTGGTISQTPNTAAQNNPYAVAGSVPGASTVQGSGINWADGSNTVTGDFKDTYGAGTGTAITNVLSSLGTSNNAAIQALINQTNTAANQQYGNIQAQEAAAGITPNSSTAALAAGDFYNQVNQGLQTNIAGMEQQQQNTLLQTLLGEGQAHGTDSSTLNNIMGALGSVGTLGQAASSAVSALSPTSSTSWLDALGAL